MGLVAVGGCKGVVLWGTQTEKKGRIPFEHDISAMAFLGNTLMCASRDLYLYDLTTGLQVGQLAGHAKPVTSVFLGSGVFYTTSEDGTIKGWDTRHQKCIKRIDTARGGVYSGAVHAGTVYYTDYSGFVHRGESSAKKQISNCSIALASSPDGLVGYDRRGRLHRIEADLSAEVECSAGKIGHYGIKCVSSLHSIGLASSDGVGLIRKAERGDRHERAGERLGPLEFYDTTRWVWDADLARDPETGLDTLYFVGSEGSLRAIRPGRSGLQTLFSVEYPLKTVRVMHQ